MRVIKADDIRHCTGLIANCQRDLKRELSPGECRDLLMDNTTFSSQEVALIVRALHQANRGEV